MTRAVVFLTVALAAASLGLFAQDTSPNTSDRSSAPTTQASTPNPSTSGQQDTSSQPGSIAPSQDATSSANATQPGRTAMSRGRAIEGQGSMSNNEAPANGQLPQTSTILPLLGLIGLGSLVAGLFARR
jgi:hypothetical protein